VSKVSKRASCISTYSTVFPEDLNHNQQLFAGQYVERMEKAAFFAATKFCQANAVAASIEALDFLESVPCGAIVRVDARVIFASRRSMVVRAELFSEDRLSQREILSARGYFIFVGLDEQGKSVLLPELLVDSQSDNEDFQVGRRVYQRCKRRRSGRL